MRACQSRAVGESVPPFQSQAACSKATRSEAAKLGTLGPPGIAAVPGDRAVAGGGLARLGEAHEAGGAEADVAALAVDDDALDPGLGARALHAQHEPVAVHEHAGLAGRADTGGGECVADKSGHGRYDSGRRKWDNSTRIGESNQTIVPTKTARLDGTYRCGMRRICEEIRCVKCYLTC